ncbi:MAG TPA: helix-hairpin-helix domain-containing protein [Candidatus Acidoferrum sp.]|nr:helix-hairpin-helix domain-containing protein [Candidatus Acidoferrum sp.]
MASWPLTARALLAAGLALCVFYAPCIAKKKPPTKPVNINTATSEELQQVPGIGPATAQKILQMRKSYGPFKSVDDLLAIRGLGQKRLDKMRKYLTVGPPAPKKTPATWAVPRNLDGKKLQSSYQWPFSVARA